MSGHLYPTSNTRKWIRSSQGELTYYSYQVLSGHGQFQTYMTKIGKTQVDICVLCVLGMKDGVEHTLPHCQALKAVRDKQVHREVTTKDGTKEMVDLMTNDRTNWAKVTAFFDDIMKRKGQLERMRRKRIVEGQSRNNHGPNAQHLELTEVQGVRSPSRPRVSGQEESQNGGWTGTAQREG